MKSSYHANPKVSNHFDLDDIKARISILDVVSRYILLKRSGRAFVGLCPFHSDRNPSFYVSEEKRAYYCFGCGEGGDAIKFIQKIEGLDFKAALAHLGVAAEPSAPLSRKEFRKKEKARDFSKRLAAWANQVSQRIAACMRDVGQRTHLAQKALKETESYPFVDAGSEEILHEEIERCEREWSILKVIHDDLVNPNLLMELWSVSVLFVKILPPGETRPADEIAKMFPPMTENYRKYLRSLVEVHCE